MSGRWWLVLPLLAVASLAGCAGPEQAPVQAPPPEVQVSLPVADTLTDFEVFTGRTQAITYNDLRARVTGYLDQAPFQQGEDVKKGDVLFVVQQKPFEDALRQAKAVRDQQKAQLSYNEAVLQRNRTLTSRNALDTEALQQALAARDTAKAAVESAEAAIALAQQNLDWSVIRAPFDGRISRRLVDPGNDVIADNTVLASLVQVDPLYAYFDMDERTLLRIDPLLYQGKVPPDAAKKFPVTLGLANEKPEAFSHQGTLAFADNKVDPGTGTLRMWGIFENPKRDLKPGLFIRVRMGVGESRPALFVAEAALGSDQGRQFLYVANEKKNEDGTPVLKEDGTPVYVVAYTPVVVGQRKNGLIAVEQGLKGGERVVVEGLQRVRPKIEVAPKVVDMPRVKDANAKTTVVTNQAPEAGTKPAGPEGKKP
jgi:RND family efflux transporter MFP subunit